MLFSSITFLYYFLPITLILYFLIPQKGLKGNPFLLKNSLLLLASFLFYFAGEPKYCFLMLGSVLVGYLGGLCIQKWKNKMILVSFVGLQLLLLGIFKYTDFAITTWNQVFSQEVSLLKFALPIGISFYSFQIISYLVDVYRSDVIAEKNPINFAAYVTMFPQLIAGPIVRYESIQKEMNKRTIDSISLSIGAKRFIIGLGKKVIIADNLGELILRFDGLSERSFMTAWIVAGMYMLQIYYDFSGYSDMAIGLGKMLGFHFPKNFDYPFISKSITEFWRRWHMTLGSFLRDYIYIPLGGSRCSKGRLIFNIFIVWTLSGLWHGASMNFVLWGVFFGIFLMIEKLFLGKILEKLPHAMGHIYTIVIVLISFVIFRFDTMEKVLQFMRELVTFTNTSMTAIEIYELKNVFGLLVIAIIGATPFMKKIVEKLQSQYQQKHVYYIAENIVIFGLLIVVTAFLIQSSVHPFLYFRF